MEQSKHTNCLSRDILSLCHDPGRKLFFDHKVGHWSGLQYAFQY